VRGRAPGQDERHFVLTGTCGCRTCPSESGFKLALVHGCELSQPSEISVDLKINFPVPRYGTRRLRFRRTNPIRQVVHRGCQSAARVDGQAKAGNEGIGPRIRWKGTPDGCWSALRAEGP
jgi:hypothetical protein